MVSGIVGNSTNYNNINYLKVISETSTRLELDKEFANKDKEEQIAKKTRFLNSKTKEQLVKLCLGLWTELPYYYATSPLITSDPLWCDFKSTLDGTTAPIHFNEQYTVSPNADAMCKDKGY